VQFSNASAVSMEIKLDDSEEVFGHGDPQNHDQNMQKQMNMAANTTTITARQIMNKMTIKLLEV
jgi:hypothetical protein